VDFLWRDAKLVVEVDGYDAHSGRVAFERDRLKAATLTANGLRILPITGGRSAVIRAELSRASFRPGRTEQSSEPTEWRFECRIDAESSTQRMGY
jgi:hypothetical protein